MNNFLTRYNMIIAQYHSLLHRYARLIIHEDETAILIATETLVYYRAYFSLYHTPDDTRLILRKRARALAHAWLAQQALQLRRKQSDYSYNQHIQL